MAPETITVLEYATKVTSECSLIDLFIQTSALISKYVSRREPIKNQVVFSFNNKTDLAEILGSIKHFETSRQPIEL